MRRNLFLLAAAAIVAMAPGSAVASGIDYLAVEQAIAAGRLVQAKAMLATMPVAQGQLDTARLQSLTASLALAEGRNDLARTLYTQLLVQAPDSCEFSRGAGIAALRLADRASAISQLGRAVALCPRSSQILSWLATAYDQEGRWSDSAPLFEQALRIDPNDPLILNNAGYSLIRQRHYADAAALLERALSLAPGNMRIANNLDIARAAGGKPLLDGARSEAAAIRAGRLNNAGYAAWQGGHLDDARAYLSQALTSSEVYSPRIAANLKLVEAELGGR